MIRKFSYLKDRFKSLNTPKKRDYVDLIDTLTNSSGNPILYGNGDPNNSLGGNGTTYIDKDPNGVGKGNYWLRNSETNEDPNSSSDWVLQFNVGSQSAAGNNTEIQFNNNSVLGASPKLTFDGLEHKLDGTSKIIHPSDSGSYGRSLLLFPSGADITDDSQATTRLGGSWLEIYDISDKSTYFDTVVNDSSVGYEARAYYRGSKYYDIRAGDNQAYLELFRGDLVGENTFIKLNADTGSNGSEINLRREGNLAILGSGENGSTPNPALFLTNDDNDQTSIQTYFDSYISKGLALGESDSQVAAVNGTIQFYDDGSGEDILGKVGGVWKSLTQSGGSGGGSSQKGVFSYHWALAGATLSHNLTNTQGFYLSVLVVPEQDIEVSEMSFWVTQSGTNYSTRLGIYSHGSSDTLLRESDNLSTATLPKGLNTISLTSPITLSKNTKYMFAIQSSSNAMGIMLRSGGYNPNSPKHLSRYDGANAGNPSSGMQSSVSYSTTNRKLLISATY